MEGKLNKTYQGMTSIASAMHLVFMLLLWWKGVRGFAVYNLFSALLYLVMTVLANKNLRIVICFTHIEICIFAVIGTVLLGNDMGFCIYLIVLSSLLFLNCFYGFLIVVLSGTFLSRSTTNYTEEEWNYVTIDELTEIYNSKYFFKKVEQTLRTSNEEFYLIYTDVLNFSLFHKIFGEEKGNELLKEVVKMLTGLSLVQCTVRGRLFEDEFGILMPKSAYQEKLLMESISTLQDRFSSSAYPIYIYAGIYDIKEHNESAKSICIKAKIAIDSIKGSYDRSIAYYDEKILKETMMRKKIIGEFNEALQGGQFCIYLQPQVTENGSLLGAEALVRWKHPEEGMIPPGTFIPLLEETSLITMLDKFVWEQAAELLQKWKKEGREQIYISVNVSAMDFYYIDVYKTFTSLVQKYDIAPANLKIEITETVLMNNTKKQMKVLEELHAFGFEVELDDFGSGYSSLSMLKDMMVDVIKIDMGFLDETEHEKRSWCILKSIMDMAEALEIKTITEGVEAEQQVKELLKIGCKVFQGYYFAKPMDVEDFTKRYLEPV